MENSEIKKIKSQKSMAIILILGSAALFLRYITKDDLEKYGNNSYFYLGGLLVLNAIGIFGFFRSYRKLKKLN